jgi:hypothetical protein
MRDCEWNVKGQLPAKRQVQGGVRKAISYQLSIQFLSIIFTSRALEGQWASNGEAMSERSQKVLEPS